MCLLFTIPIKEKETYKSSTGSGDSAKERTDFLSFLHEINRPPCEHAAD